MIFLPVVLFIIGIFVGSFLNVVIDRLPRKEGFITGRSHCDLCGHALAWYDLIPLLSYAFLLGKCRYCKKFIGYEYPLVELTTGLTFFLLPFIYTQQFTLFFVDTLFLLALFIVIFYTDIWYGIIPDIILFLALFTLLPVFIFTPSLILPHILAGIGACLFFLALFLGTRGRGMGFGDVKLAFFLGLLLGYPRIIVSLYAAFLTGAGVALILILWRKKKLRGDTIPFGPFLIVGAVLALFWGNLLWDLLVTYILHL